MAYGLTVPFAGVVLRPARDDDRDFLLRLYGTTRVDELAVVDWTDGEKTKFVAMQFEAQDTAYRETYPDGEFLVVLEDGNRIGRLYLGRLETELRLIDVTLMPSSRGHGLGSALIAWVLHRAADESRDVTLHVEPWNPARRLYERLGFETVELRGIYEFMRRSDPS